MQRANWLTCCWPGMSRLWLKGHWAGLFTALLFAGLLNLAIASKFIWPELLPPPLAWSMWPGVAGFWIFGLVQSWRQMPQLVVIPPASRSTAGKPGGREQPEEDPEAEIFDDDLFTAAQQEYLKQNWYEAETLLRKILLDCETDIHARLMLAALYRHTGRVKEADKEVSRAARSDGSEEWEFEITEQRELIAKVRSEEETESGTSLNPAA